MVHYRCDEVGPNCLEANSIWVSEKRGNIKTPVLDRIAIDSQEQTEMSKSVGKSVKRDFKVKMKAVSND